jgi:hypothetical protein
MNFEDIIINNVVFNYKNSLIKRKDWKSFKGMVKELKRLNKQYKKLNCIGDFTIRLPLPD